jgi:hypothetical protein
MLLDLPLYIVFGIPVTLAKQVIGGLRDEIDKGRLITEETIKARLQQMQMSLADGELSEEAYEKIEEELIARLKSVREYQKSLGVN